MGDYPDYSGGINIITKVIMNGRWRQKRENQRNSSMGRTYLMTLAWEVKELGKTKIRTALRSWKGEEMDSPLEPLEGTQQTPRF